METKFHATERTFITARATFSFKGVNYVAVENSKRAVEIYRVGSDGIEMFLGYLMDHRVSDDLRLQALGYLNSAFVDFRRPYQLELFA